MSIKTILTGQDLLRMASRGKRFELVRGELVEMTPPGWEHGKSAVRLARLLAEFVEEHQLGSVGVESGFYLARNPDTVRGPDAFFVSKERLDPDAEVIGFCEVVPDLVVEIVSPGDTFAEIMGKVDEYLAAGVRRVWVVNLQRRTVIVYPGAVTLRETDTLSGEDVIPGFAAPVSRLFRPRKPQA